MRKKGKNEKEGFWKKKGEKSLQVGAGQKRDEGEDVDVFFFFFSVWKKKKKKEKWRAPREEGPDGRDVIARAKPPLFEIWIGARLYQ